MEILRVEILSNSLSLHDEGALHDAVDLPAKVPKVNQTYILVVDHEASLVASSEPEQKLVQRALSSTRSSNDGHFLRSFDLKAQVVQSWLQIRLVSHLHSCEIDVAIEVLIGDHGSTTTRNVHSRRNLMGEVR